MQLKETRIMTFIYSSHSAICKLTDVRSSEIQWAKIAGPDKARVRPELGPELDQNSHLSHSSIDCDMISFFLSFLLQSHVYYE